MKARQKAYVAIALLYLLTWAVGFPMIRFARPQQKPLVIPVLPFVLYARDTTGKVGEQTVYLWYIAGVNQVAKQRMWIE